MKEFDDTVNDWDLKEPCLETISLELFSMLQELEYKINKGKIRNPKTEKIRLQQYKTFIYGCDVLAKLLSQFEDVKLEKTKKRHPISAKTRMRVLNRDNYTCQHCGATVADGVRLHIDHIKPLSKGGTNAEDNLQVLCSDCNLGKNDNENLKADHRKLIELGVING